MEERQAASTLARAVAYRLNDLARLIETLDDPREEVDAVQRARAALRRRQPDTLARLTVVEALHRGFEAQRLAMGTRPSRAAIGPASLSVVVARDLYRAAAMPGGALPSDPAPWIELMVAWQKGPGAPLKGTRSKMWDVLAKLLTKHLGGVHISGRTLKDQWQDWCKTPDHLRTRKLTKRAPS